MTLGLGSFYGLALILGPLGVIATQSTISTAQTAPPTDESISASAADLAERLESPSPGTYESLAESLDVGPAPSEPVLEERLSEASAPAVLEEGLSEASAPAVTGVESESTIPETFQPETISAPPSELPSGVSPSVESPVNAMPFAEETPIPYSATPDLSAPRGCADLLISGDACASPETPTPPARQIYNAPAPVATSDSFHQTPTVPEETLPPARVVRVQSAPEPIASSELELDPGLTQNFQSSSDTPWAASDASSGSPHSNSTTPPPGTLFAPPTVVASNGVLIQTRNSYAAVKPTRYVLKPLNSKPLQWLLNSKSIIFPLPIPMAVTSAFGWRMHPIAGNWSMHSGIDIGAPHGTPVLAAYDGQVSLAQEDGGYGLSIVLDHNQGEQQTRYAHLSEILVKPGQWVTQGTLIGLVGNTGNSTGPHLHFEAFQRTPQGMVVIDPTQSLQQALAQLVAKMPNRDPAKAIATALPNPPASSSAPGNPVSPALSKLQAQNPGQVAPSKGQVVSSPSPQVALQPPAQTTVVAPTLPPTSATSVVQPQGISPNSTPVQINPPILNPNSLRPTPQSTGTVVPQAAPQQQRLIEVQLLPLTP